MRWTWRTPFIVAGAAMVFASADAFSQQQPAAEGEQQDNPTVLFIDTGYGDTGPYLGGGVQTPNIDRLAKDGMMFASFLRPTEPHARPRRGLNA